MALEPHRLRQGAPAVDLGLAPAETLSLRQSPPAHGALGVNAHGLLEGPGGFIVPEVVHEAQALVKPHLGLGAGLDVDVAVADAGHAHGDGKLLRRREGCMSAMLCVRSMGMDCCANAEVE